MVEREQKDEEILQCCIYVINSQDGFPEPVRDINQERSKYHNGLIKSQAQLSKNRYSLMM